MKAAPLLALTAYAVWSCPIVAQQAPSPMAPPRPPPILHREEPPPAPPPRAPTVSALTTVYSSGEATGEEQFYLELINRARAAPAAEGDRLAATTDPDVLSAYAFFGVDLDLMESEFAALPAGPPLAMNAQLLDAARNHSADMFEHAFQDHESSNGDELADRATAAGYPYTSLGENIFSFADSVFQGHAGFQVDWGFDDPPDADGMQAGRGHRMNIHGDFREVGVGVVLGTNTVGSTTVGPQLVTQDFGTSTAGTAFVLGVAYYDFNGNAFYDPGEGIGGLTVNVDGSDFHAVTTAAGGYAVPVPTADASARSPSPVSDWTAGARPSSRAAAT